MPWVFNPFTGNLDWTASGTGPTPAPTSYAARFAWGDATPVDLIPLAAGTILVDVQVSITIPFDGLGAALSVGQPSDHNQFLSTSENKPGVQAEFTTAPAYEFASDTLIKLYITPGAGANAGEGIVILNYRQ